MQGACSGIGVWVIPMLPLDRFEIGVEASHLSDVCHIYQMDRGFAVVHYTYLSLLSMRNVVVVIRICAFRVKRCC
jgi:hypothetical protein